MKLVSQFVGSKIPSRECPLCGCYQELSHGSWYHMNQRQQAACNRMSFGLFNPWTGAAFHQPGKHGIQWGPEMRAQYRKDTRHA